MTSYNFDEVVPRRGTASLKWDGLLERYGDADLLPLWVADMDFKTPPEVIRELVERVQHGIFGYTIRPDSYFDAIQQWFMTRHGWKVERDWIDHAPGVVPALGLIVETFTEPGDKVIIQPPVYHPFFSVVESQGRELVQNPLLYRDGTYEMDFDDLAAKAESGAKILILCSPHNPVGRVWSREELMRLGDICLSHDILVVSDEIHGDLIYPGHRQIPFASISTEFANRSITCTAPSKTFNLAGLQTCSIIVPNDKTRETFHNALVARMMGGANTLGMVALEAAYRHGGPWLDELMVYLSENLAFLETSIQSRMPRLRVIQPEGTYMVWIDFRGLGIETKTLEEFVVKRARLALNAGSMFGVEGEGFMRMNIACPRSTLEQALNQLANAIETLE